MAVAGTDDGSWPLVQVVIKEKDAAAPAPTDPSTLWAAAQNLRLSQQGSFSGGTKPLRPALSGLESRLSDSDFKLVCPGLITSLDNHNSV